MIQIQNISEASVWYQCSKLSWDESLILLTILYVFTVCVISCTYVLCGRLLCLYYMYYLNSMYYMYVFYSIICMHHVYVSKATQYKQSS